MSVTITRAVVTTGGTGGHIFPALAVANEMLRRNPACEVTFMGGSGPEGELARKAGLDFVELPARGVMGGGISNKLGALIWVVKSVMRGRKALKNVKPQVVIGFGGYAGFSPVLAAWTKSIPSAVHEQNSVPGVTNRALGKVVQKIFLSFKDRLGLFPADKTQLVGNPVREGLAETRRERGTGRNLLVLGGSQGAKPINDAIIEALPQLMEANVSILHQAGKADEERVRAAYEKAGADPNSVRGFMDDMGEAYGWADLAICRSGASTVFELAAVGLPAVFVPFPQATHDHQTANAQAAVETGGAKLVPQGELTPEGLAVDVADLFTSGRLAEMGGQIASFAKLSAAADVVDELEKMVAGNTAA